LYVYNYIGERNPLVTNYYYVNFCYYNHHPWPARELQSSLLKMKELELEDLPSVRKNKAKESGFTGISILHTLNTLYGFDVIKGLYTKVV